MRHLSPPRLLSLCAVVGILWTACAAPQEVAPNGEAGVERVDPLVYDYTRFEYTYARAVARAEGG